MAKQKKVNKRVVVLLVLMGMVVMAVVAGKLVKKIFPPNPDALAALARKATEDQRYGKAELLWRKAIKANPRQEFRYEFAELQVTILKEVANLPKTEVRERMKVARDQLQVALRQDPNFEKARISLAEMMWISRNWTDYIKQADKLLEIVPDDHEVYNRRGHAKSRLAETTPLRYKQAAIDDFRKAIELNPGESDYWLALIGFYHRMGDSEQVEQLLIEALDKISDSVTLHVAYASVLHKAGRDEEAKAQIDQAIAADPNDISGHLAKSDFYSNRKEYALELEALQAASLIDPGKIEIYEAMSRAYRRNRQPEKAIESIRDGLASVDGLLATALGEGASGEHRAQLKDSEARLHYLLAGMLLGKGEANLSQLKELDAEVAASLAIIERRDSNSPMAAKIAGWLALHAGDRKRSTELLEKADAGFEGRDLRTAFMLIELYFDQAPGKAEILIDRYLGTPEYGSNPSLLLKKARLEMKYREYDKATMRLNRVVTLTGTNVPAMAEMARTLLAELDVLRGRTIQLPRDMDLSNPAVIRRMARHAISLWVSDEKDKAFALMSELHERQPDNVQVTSNLYKMYLVRGEKAKGIELVEKAIARQPDSKELRRFKILIEDPQKRVERLLEMADENEDPMQRALRRAGIYAASGMREEYLAQLRKAEEIDPNNQAVVGSLFRYALIDEDWEMAEEMLARATAINADGVDGAEYKANLAMARKQFDEAIEVLVKLVEQYPGSKQGKMKLGLAYMEANQPQKAENLYRELVEDDPGFTNAVIGMIKATAVLGKTEETNRWVEKAYRLAPENSYVRRMHLDSIQATAAPETIIPQRLAILKTNPGDIPNIYMLGQLYIRANQPAKAEEMFLKIWNDPKVDKLETARILLAYYGSQGRFPESNDVLMKLLSATEDKVAVWVLYGQFLTQYDVVKAQGAFEKAITEGPQDPRGYLAMTSFYSAQRQWKEAVETARKSLELNPDDRVMQRSLMRFLVEAGQYDEANRLMDKAFVENSDDIDILILKGRLAGRQELYEQAEQWLTKAIKQDPNSYEALFNRSGIHRRTGNLPEARKDMEAARQISDTLNISMRLAALLTQMGDVDDAQIIYAGILQKYPDAKQAIVRVLDLHLAERRWTLMDPILQKAIQRAPMETIYRIYEARMELARGNGGRAIEVLSEAVSHDKQNRGAVMFYLEILIDAGQTQKAIAIARDYTQKPGFGSQATAIQARALAAQNQPAEAEQLFAEAISKAQPEALRYIVVQVQKAYGNAETIGKLEIWAESIRSGDWQIRQLIGNLHFANKDYSKAVDSYRQAMQLTTDEQLKALIQRNMGRAYQTMGQPYQAEKAYLAVLKINKDDLPTLNNLAYLYTEDMDQPRKALPHAERVAKAQPGNGNVLDTYGWSLAKAGKLLDAEQQLNRAVALVPHLAVVRYHLGWVFEQKGRLNEAAGEYRRGNELLGDASDDSLKETLREALERVQTKLTGEE